MSSANTTEFYGLTQYVGTDKPSFTDNNIPFQNVDHDLHEVVQSAEAQGDAITQLTGRVSDVEDFVTTQSGINQGVADDIQAIKNKNGEQDLAIAAVKADALDMICAYNEPTATSTRAYNVGDYFRYNDVLYKATQSIAIGDTIVPDSNCETTNVTTELLTNEIDLSNYQTITDNTLDTTSKEVVGAINEVNSGLADGNLDASRFVSVTSNGTETRSQLFDRLYALVDFTKVTKNPLIEFNGVKRFCEIEGTTIKGTLANCAPTKAAINTITCIASSSTIYDVQIESGSVTFNNESSTVLSAGIVAKFIY